MTRSGRTHTRAAAALAGVLVIAAGAPLGCSSAPKAALPSESVAPAPTEALARRIGREQRRPDARAKAAPIPPGVESAALEPVDPDDPVARTPLSGAVAYFSAQPDDVAAAAASQQGAGAPVDPDDRARAVRLYIAGRAKRLDGNARAAVADLTAASELDPASPEIWRALAEAHQDAGDRLAAISAFRTSLAIDGDDPRALAAVGRSLLERRDPEAAARLLARAHAQPAEEPALRRFIAMGLGQSLHELGYLAAGNEALALALDLPDRWPGATVYRDELGELYRERAQLWRDAGDAAARLGDYAAAVRAYDESGRFPSFDPGALAPRRVHALLRLGRPAAAASMLLADIRASTGRVEDRQLRLIEHLARHTDVGPLLGDGVAAVEASIDPALRPIVAGRLARARAAALPDPQARDVLRARIAESPADQNALSDFFGRFDPADTRALVAAAQSLIAAAPLETPRYADALLRVQPQADALERALADSSSGPAAPRALLHAELLKLLGRTADAERELRAVAAADPAHAACAVALARLLGETGRRDDAIALLAELDASTDPGVRLARAVALNEMGLADDALVALEPLLSPWPNPAIPPAAAARVAMLAAQLNLATQQWREGERWCRAALEIDPTLEDAHAGLIALYANTGPLADNRRLAEAVRDLRVASPSSRTLRWLRAQDLVRAGQLDQAESDLLGLAEEEPSPAVVDLLVDIWGRTGSLDRAESWLRDKLERRPTDTALTAELARVLTADARAAEAESLLRAAIAQRPYDRTLLRRLETILRDALGRVDEADAMAIERLRNTPPTLERSIEIAQLAVRAGRVDEASDALREGLLSGREPRAEELNALAQTALQVAERVAAGQGDGPRAVAMLDALAQALPATPPAIHGARLLLMATHEPDVERINAAIGLAAAQSPDVAAELAVRTTDALRAANRIPDALAVAERAARRGAATDDRLVARWLQFAMEAADVESAAASVRFAVDKGASQRLLRLPFPDARSAGAELAHQVAMQFARADQLSPADRDAASDKLYRLALAYDPTHAMAANNLAYRMVERNENLLEAERLLETAYRIASTEAAIIDSLAWARYKLGDLEDVVGADGAVIREGALTLLEKAMALEDGQQDPTINDHLGDVYWRLGRREDAKRRWTVARSLAEETLRRFETEPRPAVTEAYQPIIDGAAAKLAAAQAGKEPEVAPIVGRAASPTPAPLAPTQPADNRPAPAPGLDGAGAL